VNGSSSHLVRSILVKVLRRRETTRLAIAHLYLVMCFSHVRMSIVISAVQIWISTALRVVPMKLFMRSSCLRLRKKISMSHLAL